MTTRRHYLVSYDIADDKRRNKAFEACQQHGDHAQFSVFFAQLNPREYAEFVALLRGIIHHTEDQVMLVDLGLAHRGLDGEIETIGKPFAVSNRVIVV
jgi:CRISPR-associated protein Cas2